MFDFSFKTIHILAIHTKCKNAHFKNFSVSLGFRPNSMPKVGKRRLKQSKIAPGVLGYRPKL